MPPKKRERNMGETSDVLRFSAHRSKTIPIDEERILTPLEKQFLAIKKQHPDTVLLVECGYKMMFFGRDAEIASKHLNIQCMRKDGSVFDHASVPVPRANHHIFKLVEQGYRVGAVRQTETASGRAEEGGKGVFERSLTGSFTRGTWLLSSADTTDGAEYVTSHNTKHSIAVILENGNNICVAWTSLLDGYGKMSWDSFQDTPMLHELETRMWHIDPCDILAPKAASVKLITLLRGVFGINTGVDAEHNGGTVHFETFTPVSGGSSDSEMCQKALDRYMAQVGVPEYVKTVERCEKARGRDALLPASTMDNLEIFSSADGTENHTLFTFLCRTKSSMGARELKRWIRSPLADPLQLAHRQSMVSSLVENSTARTTLSEMFTKPHRMPDLEIILQKVVNRSVGVKQFSRFLRAMVQVSAALRKVTLECLDIGNVVLAGAVSEEHVKQYSDAMWDSDDCAILFSNETNEDEASARKLENFLENEHRLEICAQLKISKSDFQYSTVSGVAYLIEVPSNLESRVPKSWSLENRIKTAARYQTDLIKSSATKIAYHREKAKLACTVMWSHFLETFVAKHYEVFRSAVKTIALVDCLGSFSEVAQLPGYTKPVLLHAGSSPHAISATAARHPLLETLRSESYVPNDILLSAECPVILTGPNMGGKSVFLKMIGVLSLMAQIGSYVPAASFSFTPFDAFFTRMGSRDDAATICGRSTFMYEMSETSEVLRHATARSLVLMDEIGRGTSTFDGTAIAFAVLGECIRKKSATVFVTHFPILQSLSPPCVLMRMGFCESTDDVTLLYKICVGVSPSSFGMNVARMAGMPDVIVQVAESVSTRMKMRIELRQALQATL